MLLDRNSDVGAVQESPMLRRLLPFSFLFAAAVGFSQETRQPEPVPKGITVEELDKLPEGIKVVHEPTSALATLSGKSDRRGKYTWWYKTTVTATAGDVTIVEFGAFVLQNDKWVNGGTITGKPYGRDEFAEWYKCPKAVLKKGESFSDPTNWSTDDELRGGKARWYYIGVDANGKRVKGEAVIVQEAKIDPKKPTDKDQPE